MVAVLPRVFGFLQRSLNTEVCPGFHRVVFVVLSGKRKKDSLFAFSFENPKLSFHTL